MKVRVATVRRWPVNVVFQECSADGMIDAVEGVFIGLWKPFDEEAIAKLRSAIYGPEPETEEARAAAKRAAEERTVAEAIDLEAKFIGALLDGWEQITGPDDQPLPYSQQALAGLLKGFDGAAYRRGFNQAILELRFGTASEKNVRASRSPGSATVASEAAPTS